MSSSSVNFESWEAENFPLIQNFDSRSEFEFTHDLNNDSNERINKPTSNTPNLPSNSPKPKQRRHPPPYSVTMPESNNVTTQSTLGIITLFQEEIKKLHEKLANSQEESIKFQRQISELQGEVARLQGKLEGEVARLQGKLNGEKSQKHLPTLCLVLFVVLFLILVLGRTFTGWFNCKCWDC